MSLTTRGTSSSSAPGGYRTCSLRDRPTLTCIAQAIGGIDSPKDPKKARASFDLLSEHLASRPGVVEVVVRSNVIMGKLSFRAVLTRRLRLVPTSPQTSPRSSPRLERESTRKSPAPDAKEKRVSARKSGMPDTGMLGTISSLLGSGKRTQLDRRSFLDAHNCTQRRDQSETSLR